MRRVFLMQSDELWEGEKKHVRFESLKLLLVRLNGELRVFEDRCPHLGMPLSAGSLTHTNLKCMSHGWEFDALTGEGINPCGTTLRRYRAWEDGGKILAELPLPALMVGPVLTSGEMAAAVARAIQTENPDAVVKDHGAYLRVQVPNRCHISKSHIEKCIDRPIDFPSDLEIEMLSFAGRLTLTHDSAVWEAP